MVYGLEVGLAFHSINPKDKCFRTSSGTKCNRPRFLRAYVSCAGVVGAWRPTFINVEINCPIQVCRHLVIKARGSTSHGAPWDVESFIPPSNLCLTIVFGADEALSLGRSRMSNELEDIVQSGNAKVLEVT